MSESTRPVSGLPEVGRGRVRIELRDGWAVRAGRGPVPTTVSGAVVPAQVPGCVHTDLLAAGLIPDPFLDDNESATNWIGLTDWEYRTAFEWAPDGRERQEIVFEGLDTVATVSLNGELLGAVDNMHRTWRFEVSKLLRAGVNELGVAFESPVRYADRTSFALGMRPTPYSTPYNAIRKMAASFGWDWGPKTATSGIWRSVWLESWAEARIARVTLEASPASNGGTLRARVAVAGAVGPHLRVSVAAVGVVEEAAIDTGEADIVLGIPGVRLWWPRGFGDQPRYDVEILLLDETEVLDRARRRIGFRTVRWEIEPSDEGSSFQLFVNDQSVYVRGANWIPDDALVTRVDRERYRTRLLQGVGANLNLVRVWGGGVFEADDFYDLCDELGLLVWQDFLFACAAYSEDFATWTNIEAEARDNLVRIAHHPCLALFNGSNEDLQGYEEWGWQRVLDGMTWGETYYRVLFPALVEEFAPGVPYIPSSPFSPSGEPANSPRYGSMHIWDMWNQRDWLGYREYRPRFVTEFGWQGPPAWTTLVRAVHDDPLTPESPGMLSHQKAFGGNFKLTAGLLPHLTVPRDIEDWHWAMQLNQAMAVRAALTHFRSLAPLNAGAVVWQLNDCWPVTSWAAIDGDGRLKPAWYAIREAFADRLVTVQPDGGGLQAVVVNDGPIPWTGSLHLRRLDFAGTMLASEMIPVSIPARGLLRVAIDPAFGTPRDPAREALVVELDDERDVWFFAEPRDSSLVAPVWTVEWEPDSDGVVLHLTPDVVVRDAFLMADKLDPAATVDQGMVTVLPGECWIVHLRGLTEVDAGRVVQPNILRCANQLVVR